MLLLNKKLWKLLNKHFKKSFKNVIRLLFNKLKVKVNL